MPYKFSILTVGDAMLHTAKGKVAKKQIILLSLFITHDFLGCLVDQLLRNEMKNGFFHFFPDNREVFFAMHCLY
jgi:hypothetical protein